MNVVFLDYDGVVNTPMWDKDGKRCRYNYAYDNAVNNFQAVQWLSEFCQKYDFDIVVTSSWRFSHNYKECLINGGLREGINIIDATPILSWARTRGEEIAKYLKEHPEVEYYIIFDDDDDMENDLGFCLKEHFIQCVPEAGITMREFRIACRMYEEFTKRGEK